MRQSLSSIGLFLTFLVHAQFAPPCAQWTYDQEGGTYAMTVVGDTVLNGHACSIIEGSSPSICWQSQAYTYQSGDTVYWSDDPYLPQFFELYRWNAQPGESWDVWSNGPVTVTYTVLSTGTTTVNGQTLRTLNVSATDTQQQWAQSSGVLVEHVGDTLFLFPWLAAFCDAMVPWPLRCYTDTSLGTFLRPGITDCAPEATNTVFAPIGATWTYTQHYAFSADSALMVIECVGDTVIDGLTCSILEPTQGAGGCMPFHRYVSTVGDSVLFWCGADSSFQTLFDIGADIGDSWSMRADYNGSWMNGDTLTWTVTDTGSTVIDGLTLHTLEVAVQSTQNAGTAPLSDEVIVERLGPFPYLFPWIFGACDGELNGPLRCYTDADISWLNPQFAQCALSVGLEELGDDRPFDVWPNPVEPGGTLTIRPRRPMGPASLEVSDVLGRILGRWALSGDQLVLRLPGTGVFLITWRDGSGTPATVRVVVP